MNPPATELISPEEARSQGASAPATAMVLAVGEAYHAPASVYSSNVRSMHRDGDKVFVCEGVVLPKPVIFNQELILVESTAPLLGFYNAEPGVLCGAYGKPQPLRAWRVVVGSTLKPYVISGAIHYESIVFHLVAEHPIA